MHSALLWAYFVLINLGWEKGEKTEVPKSMVMAVIAALLLDAGK
jgi:hypothetical protein